MKFHQTDRGVEIPLTIDFDLSQTLECGQCFRWNKTEDGAFQGIVKGKAISVREDAGSQTIVLEGVSQRIFPPSGRIILTWILIMRESEPSFARLTQT